MLRRNRKNSNRSSERDIALVRLQLDAQFRNRRWHAFLCARRDELQARLGSDRMPLRTSYASTTRESLDSSERPSNRFDPGVPDDVNDAGPVSDAGPLSTDERRMLRHGPDWLPDFGGEFGDFESGEGMSSSDFPGDLAQA